MAAGVAEPLLDLEVALHRARAEEERRHTAYQAAETAAIEEYWAEVGGDALALADHIKFMPRFEAARERHNVAEPKRIYMAAVDQAIECERQIAITPARTSDGVMVRMRLLAQWVAAGGAPYQAGKGAGETLARDLVAEVEHLARRVAS